MKWKIKQFVFCENKQLLQSFQNPNTPLNIQLEPRQAEVLAYFCRNVERTISRDELVNEVWQGQTVTDNAVNRIIAKLRKSLGDSAKQSEFIVTLPRKGYRFICPVEEWDDASNNDNPSNIEHLNNTEYSLNSGNTINIDSTTSAQPYSKNEPTESKSNLTNRKTAIWLIIMVVVVFIGWQLASRQQLNEHSKTSAFQFQSVKALTRDKGQEYLPSLSPNGRYLIYAAYQNKRLDLYLKDTQTERTKLISDQHGNAGNGDWSRDGKQYLYFYNSEQKCELRVATFDPLDSMKLIDKQTVHQCRNRGFGNFAFGHDGRSIIFSEIDSSLQSYSIYVKHLDNNRIEHVKQPPIFLAGNSEFDLHPTKNRLLIASPDKTQNLSFYISDLDSNTLEKKFSMDGYICCPVWSQKGDKIIMAGALPANTIIEMDLEGINLKTIYSASHSIHRLKRAPKSNSFVYSGGIQNTDIRQASLKDRSTQTIISSTVPDYLPSLSNKSNYLAYISQRTGNSEVWIRDLEKATDRKLTQFKDNQQYFELQWSPNNQKLIALTINHIKLIDFISGQDFTLDIAKQQIRGISWIDDDTISLSLKIDDYFAIYHYDLINKQLSPADNQYAYQLVDSNSQESVQIDHNGKFFYRNKPLSINIENPIDHHRRFNFKFKDGAIYYFLSESTPSPSASEKQNNKTKYHLVKYVLANGTTERLFEFEHPVQFSIDNETIYSVFTAERNADIFRVDFKAD